MKFLKGLFVAGAFALVGCLDPSGREGGEGPAGPEGASVEPGVERLVKLGFDKKNIRREARAISSKGTFHAAKHEFGHSVGIGHTDQMGPFATGWSNVNIAGTPTSDANSVFNSTIGTPMNFSAHDITAIRFLYPSGAILVRRTTNELFTEGPAGLIGNVRAFQQDGDRILALLNDGTLMGKNGNHGAWVTLMGGVTAFRMSGDRIGCLTSDRRFFTKTSLSGAWVLQTTNAVKIDMDGAVFAAIKTDGALWGTPNGTPSGWANLYGPTVTDFQLEGARIGVLHGGNLYLKDGFSAVWGAAKRTGVQRFQLDGNRVATLQNGTLWAGDGINGTWHNQISGVSDFDISGTRIGALAGGSLYVKEGLQGTWTNQYAGLQAFKLTKYYISLVNSSGTLVAKYDLHNSWQAYTTQAAAFAQR